MSRPPLHALQGFLAAARHGNLSRAAGSMHLTVSALSHQMRALEQRLGQQLFVRGARGVELTGAGRALMERIAPHLDAIEQALRPGRVGRDDRLTVTVLPSFASSWLVPRLPRFVAAQPQIELSLQSNTARVDFDREPDIDAGVRFGPGQWPGVEAVHLFDDAITPVASPALLERLGTPTLASLGGFPLIGAPGGRWSEWFGRFGGHAPARFVATFDESESLHRAAVEGLGVVLGRVTLARPMIEAGRLVRLFDAQLRSDYAYYLVHPPRSADHRGLLAFRDWLLAESRTYVGTAAHANVAASP